MLLRHGALLAFALALPVCAQQFPFQINVSINGNSAFVTNGSTIAFSAPVGGSQTAQVTLTYSGNGQATISTQPNVLGSSAFQASLTGQVPVTLQPGQSANLSITYHPTTSSQTSAQLSLPFTETVSNSSGTGSSTNNGTVSLVLQGSAPSFTLSYVLQTDQNVIPLQPSGTITFHPTQINTIAQATLNITNQGTGPGQITNITVTPGAFKVLGIPLFPFTLAPNQTLSLAIQYQPTGTNSDTAQIQISLPGNVTDTVNLQGSGILTTFVYQVLLPNQTVPVTPGGSVNIPDTSLGATTSVVIRVQNGGSTSAQVGSISVSGPGYMLANAPTLPQTLAPNGSLTFTVNFTPTKPGPSTAQVTIGNDSFQLVGNGLGPNLVYSYMASGGATTQLGTNPTVVFPPVQVSQTEQLSFTVQNTGTQAATINNIGIVEANSPFSIPQLSLPVTIPPNGQLTFPITFTPATVGFSNGTLRLDTTTIALTGSGTAPPALPTYTIQGPSGNTAPMTQPTVSLSLSAPYPVALSGMLTLTVSSTFITDPAVQFSTGGRTVAFTIPANSTSAVFANQSTQIAVQTGTVASTVTITPSFSTQSGNINLTPASASSLQFSVPVSAPVLTAVSLAAQTGGVVLTVTGFSTSRTLTSMMIQFVPNKGFKMPTSQFTVDLHQASATWFQSSASQAFGGQFTIAITFVLQSTLPTGKTLLNTISSVSVTAANETGASNSVQTIF